MQFRWLQLLPFRLLTTSGNKVELTIMMKSKPLQIFQLLKWLLQLPCCFLFLAFFLLWKCIVAERTWLSARREWKPFVYLPSSIAWQAYCELHGIMDGIQLSLSTNNSGDERVVSMSRCLVILCSVSSRDPWLWRLCMWTSVYGRSNILPRFWLPSELCDSLLLMSHDGSVCLPCICSNWKNGGRQLFWFGLIDHIMPSLNVLKLGLNLKVLANSQEAILCVILKLFSITD